MRKTINNLAYLNYNLIIVYIWYMSDLKTKQFTLSIPIKGCLTMTLNAKDAQAAVESFFRASRWIFRSSLLW